MFSMEACVRRKNHPLGAGWVMAMPRQEERKWSLCLGCKRGKESMELAWTPEVAPGQKTMLLHLWDNRDPGPGILSLDFSQPVSRESQQGHSQLGFPKTLGWCHVWCIYGLGRHLAPLNRCNHFWREVTPRSLFCRKGNGDSEGEWLAQGLAGLQLHLSYAATHVQGPKGEVTTSVCVLPYFPLSWALELRNSHSFLLRNNIRKKAEAR